jgi:hypothetical protein
MKDRFANQLLVILEKCTKLMPYASDHFYRLGALLCIIGDERRALEAFRKAGKLDRNRIEINPVGAYVNAKMVFSFDSKVAKGDIGLAEFAAHAARAIYAGRAIDIKEILTGSFDIEVARHAPGGVPTALSVVDKMLSEALSPGTQPAS